MQKLSMKHLQVNLDHIGKVIHQDQGDFFLEIQGWANLNESINVIHRNGLQDRNHTIIFVDTEKAFDRIKHPVWQKSCKG